ncbi:MAG: hypothetical protein U9O96_04590 [Candidatus Thermoplasmatota archaeon]|nr:hypothetical protein [Candidatus Thermoplasmatota archaeon]
MEYDVFARKELFIFPKQAESLKRQKHGCRESRRRLIDGRKRSGTA